MSEVAKFYVGKTIFLTGGTGFLGKALIEKLLYSCSDIRKIYVLVREKKGKSAQERINHLFNMPPFERLRFRPGCQSKLVGLSGDAIKPNLDLTEDQIQGLKDEVSIVFHLAATVNFNETLQDALDVNAKGTMEIIKLCHQMKNIQALVHVSTAFSNSEHRYIDEVVYPPPHELKHAICFAEQYSDDDKAVRTFLSGKPNTYTYSKALAEDIVVKTRGDISAAIVRPSIVMASLKEPCPGWVDNWNGPTGLMVGMPSGMLKVTLGRGHNMTDLIPVDIVTNLCIVAASRCQSTKEVKVYNCCSSASNPITNDQCQNIAKKTALKYSLSPHSRPFLIFTSSHFLYYLINFLLQIVPACLLDLWLFKEQKPKMKYTKIQLKFNKMVHAVKFFLLHEWNFVDKNVRSLWESMSGRDKEMFNFDVRSIVWEQCIENYVLGARKYLLEGKSIF